MHNGKVITLGSIIWKVMKHPAASDLSFEEGAEFALEFIRLMGAPLIYADTISEPIKLNMYKARIPDDLLFIKGVKYVCDTCDNSSMSDGVAMQYATDIYHNGIAKDIVSASRSNTSSPQQGYSYVINKGIITTSIESGAIVISYKGLTLDEDGFPLIPDNESFKLGLEYYILHRYMEPLWVAGKIPDKVFQYIEQKRHWYYSSAHTSLQMPSIDQMESIMNGINRIVSDTTAHKKFFRGYGIKERIKKYH